MIHCAVKSIELNSSFFVSIIYALHTPVARRSLWSELGRLSQSILVPWSILGDFNETLQASEINGGSELWDFGNEEFKNCLESISVEDLRATGAHLTWWNSQDDNPIYKKLDRILVNEHWLSHLGSASAFFGPMGFSDHCPAILYIGLDLPRIHKPFQFFNFMLDLDGFSDALASAWNCSIDGDPLFVLAEKLKRSKKAICGLNRSLGNLSSAVALGRHQLNRIQTELSSRPGDRELLQLQRECSTNLWDAIVREEALLKQKSRVLWLKEGDSNSKFFHSKVKSRWNTNKILSIENDEGVVVQGHDHVQKVAVDYFTKLLGSAPPSSYSGIHDMGHLFSRTISPAVALTLDREVLDVEILAVLKSMKKNKSPGPDGFNVNFFLSNWAIVGHDFLAAVKSFFRQGCRLKATNSTAIALIPKGAAPSSMGDFRPISCCNTTYKCISKIIANRLKSTLPFLISSAQAAFIPGRKIGDNILLAQELMRNYHRDSGPPRCTLKIDLKKAFDSVRWEFLFDVLFYLKFPPKFIFWIRACISTPSYSVKINGALCGFFKGAKGLRQGDPLSPYLFVIIMNCLSLIIEDSIKRLPFKFHWRTSTSHITNLCFADDLMLFCNGDSLSVSTLHSSLSYFSELSGLVPNLTKSQCFLANVCPEQTSRILDILQFQRGYTPAIFLGVPLISSKLSGADCRPLVDRIISRISVWHNKFLSFSGRIELVRSVLFAIQAYWSSYFVLPSSILKEIKSVLMRFIWKGPSLQKHGSKVAWAKLALPFSEGGLNIKHILDWNTASILLHVWNVANPHSSSLWAKWIRDTVIKDKNFWTLPIPSDCSWIWRKVLKLRSIAINHIQYQIGNGFNTSLWFDPWFNKAPIASSAHDLIVVNSGLGPKATVADILSSSGWILPPSNHAQVINFRSYFDYSLPYDLSQPDTLSWDSSTAVTKAVIWDSIRCRGNVVDWWELVWHKLHVPKFSFYLWLAFHKGFKTKDVLLGYGLDVSAGCHLCTSHTETFPHLFFQCSYSYHVMFHVLRNCGWRGVQQDWDSITAFVMCPQHSKIKCQLLSLGLSATVYHLWRERNSRMHGEPAKSAASLSREIVHIVKCKLHSSNKFRNYAVHHRYNHLLLASLP